MNEVIISWCITRLLTAKQQFCFIDWLFVDVIYLPQVWITNRFQAEQHTVILSCWLTVTKKYLSVLWYEQVFGTMGNILIDKIELLYADNTQHPLIIKRKLVEILNRNLSFIYSLCLLVCFSSYCVILYCYTGCRLTVYLMYCTWIMISFLILI